MPGAARRIRDSSVRAALLLVALAAAGVNGYAKYWWEPAIGVMPDGNPCHAHPERAYYDLTDAEGFFLESPHGIPYHEDGITFEFREQTGGDLTTRVCPGANYTGKLSLPVLGLALLSMSEGRFLSPGPTPGCRNRVDLGASSSPRAQTSFAFAFAVPCNLTGDLEFRVTAAQRGYPSTWMQAAATLAAAGPGECPQQQRVLACGADASGGGTLDPADPKLQPDPVEPTPSSAAGPQPQSPAPAPHPPGKGPKQQGAKPSRQQPKRRRPPPQGSAAAARASRPPPGRQSPPPRKSLQRR
ncbi:hypothetical protein CHLRE_03g203569v5 [Chlamydomonas reinhardtii]|uniref:Uncharacterized protein n=1 Tax=Chlamydomonas reinhardtii TaxID=3055 RepID=A0A2K3DZN6_CHLRE|nr:uncharacterized protein CHLRE_03g203569v5 [Chlamydomonas reinhardtii]PNW85998.1 hypothetical protein CHLRE_03g203569v5 [Chlamydomonas reinhardtii]